MRLFVAIAPPAAVISDLDAACGPLRGPRADLRWTATQAWHVTLAFLGEVEDGTLSLLMPRLERGARRHAVFGMRFHGAGAFPFPARANVLWSGIDGDRKALGELAATVAAGARRAGAPPPDAGRRFQPHLTLARCRAPANVEPLVAALDGYEGPAWRVEQIHLIRSNLPAPGATAGPRYETLGAYKLCPAPRVPPD